jgi:hypothetical protein
MVVPLHVMTAADEPAACFRSEGSGVEGSGGLSIRCAKDSTAVAMSASRTGILAVKFQESSTALY